MFPQRNCGHFLSNGVQRKTEEKSQGVKPSIDECRTKIVLFYPSDPADLKVTIMMTRQPEDVCFQIHRSQLWFEPLREHWAFHKSSGRLTMLPRSPRLDLVSDRRRRSSLGWDFKPAGSTPRPGHHETSCILYDEHIISMNII